MVHLPTPATRLAAVVAAAAVLVGACGGGATPAPSSGGASPSAAPSAASPSAAASTAASPAAKQYVIGISNTLQGNGWREEMICSMKAEAKVSGQVSKLVIVNRTTDAAGQIEDLRTLISAGVDAIVLNPADPTALNSVIKQATDKGIVVVAVDQSVTEPSAYVLSNDQEQYGYLGAKWLFEQLHGQGNVVYMRGIKGAPADTDRDHGFRRALAEYPNIKIVAETFTNWSQAPAAQEIQDLFNAGTKIDGIWTSGIDAVIVDAYKTAKKPFVPIVGADNNKFVGQLVSEKPNGLVGAAVTNPPPVGGAGIALALQLLNGQKPSQREIKLTPEVWDNTTDAGLAKLKAAYDPQLDDYYGVNYTIPNWTHYTKADLIACKGPGE
jgi:ribose transport system substrate-binding protein